MCRQSCPGGSRVVLKGSLAESVSLLWLATLPEELLDLLLLWDKVPQTSVETDESPRRGLTLGYDVLEDCGLNDVI